jgi:ribonuclease BN (tRNA processing enzyme)
MPNNKRIPVSSKACSLTAMMRNVGRVRMLVIEATYLRRESDMARRFAHLTAAQAAQLAQDANARRLVSTHVSRRYLEAGHLPQDGCRPQPSLSRAAWRRRKRKLTQSLARESGRRYNEGLSESTRSYTARVFG